MCAWLAIVNVQYNNGDHDTESYEYHSEQEVLAKQGQCQRGRRYDFRYQKEEHGLRQENADAQCNFFARISRQIEYQHREVRDADTRYYQIDCVE